MFCLKWCIEKFLLWRERLGGIIVLLPSPEVDSCIHPYNTEPVYYGKLVFIVIVTMGYQGSAGIETVLAVY